MPEEQVQEQEPVVEGFAEGEVVAATIETTPAEEVVSEEAPAAEEPAQ